MKVAPVAETVRVAQEDVPMTRSTTTLLYFVIGCFCPSLTAVAADRPNIVVVLVDDLGFSDIGPYGGEVPTPAFLGKPLTRTEPIFWEHEGNKAVRDGKWKLVRRHRQSWQLFDMEADRTEQHDLAPQQPERVAELKTMWNAWARRAFVDEWPGPDHTEWGEDIRPR